MLRRVVVTGMGVISPLGTGLERFWESLSAGRSGVGAITRFAVDGLSCRIGAEVRDFDPAQYLDRKEARHMDRFTQFAVAAAGMALDDAGLAVREVPAERVGVILGTGIGGIETMGDQHRVLMERGPGRVSPYFIPMMIANMAAGQVAILYGAKGPNTTVITACASATNAIGEAFRLVQRGDADVALTGGSEAPIVPLAYAGFCSMRALTSRNDEPERASRPFDRDRDGFVMGEGAAVLVVEELGRALRRGARIHCEILGYGASADAYHVSAPSPGGEGGARSMAAALADAGLEPGAIDYINAHGTSTALNDRLETEAIKTVFKDHARRLAVSSTKSMHGHLLGASGAVEFVATALAIQRGRVPPTINLDTPDPDCDLDYVPNVARPMAITNALSNSFGFGGQNATLALGRRGW